MKKTLIFIALSFMVIFLSACSNSTSTNNSVNSVSNNQNYVLKPNQPVATTSVPQAITSVDPSLLNLTEIAKHNSVSDCWLAISGQVYNLTPYTSAGLHPGGDKILNGCGKDATLMYQSIGKHNSPTAKSTLGKYLLGNLQK